MPQNNTLKTTISSSVPNTWATIPTATNQGNLLTSANGSLITSAPGSILTGGTFTFKNPEPSASVQITGDHAKFIIEDKSKSGWVCYMFGGFDKGKGSGVIWKPSPEHLPNRFQRFMQYLFFKNVWVKED